jgi:hypothetical protein
MYCCSTGFAPLKPEKKVMHDNNGRRRQLTSKTLRQYLIKNEGIKDKPIPAAYTTAAGKCRSL